MRYYILFLTLCFSLSLCAQEVQLSWNKDYNVATELAKSESKPILVYFTKSDCKACLEFYTDFFKQDAFKSISDDFILLMLDGSNNDIKNTDMDIIKKRRLVMHYNKALIFPALMALNNEGKELSDLYTSKDLADMATYFTFLKTLK
jgi:thioredoxin-related protein